MFDFKWLCFECLLHFSFSIMTEPWPHSERLGWLLSSHTPLSLTRLHKLWIVFLSRLFMGVTTMRHGRP